MALKVPFLGGDDAGTRERFYREARAAAALHHANICPVFDVGELHGVPYLTMAFIEGRSLARALEAGQPFTPSQAALLVRKLALAMQEAHARGVIHRDLKPANVLLRPDGEPVIMDFGLARRGDESHGEGLTRAGRRDRHHRVHVPGAVRGGQRGGRPGRPTCTRWAWSCTRC